MRALAIFALGFAPACGLLLDNTHKITASDAAAYTQFGLSVAKSGDVIVVGAAFFDDDHSNQAVYVYRTSDGGATYDEIAKLTAAALEWESAFGYRVAIDGDTIVVGTYNKAAVYVFRVVDGGVNEVATLTADVAAPCSNDNVNCEDWAGAGECDNKSETRAKKQFGVKKTHAAAKLKRRRCKRQ